MPTNAAKNLAGKTVLITGASSGIGRSCAFEFARTSPESLKLILTARRIDRLHEIAKKITDEVGDGVKIYSMKLDVSKPDEVTKLWQDLPEDFQDIDVLVNNAGFMSGYERAPDIPPKIIDDVWATNVTGWINMTQEFLKIAKQRDQGGRGDVVMIGSMAGREPYAGGSIYCASKAAIRSFTDALRKELIATKIRVITVDPGQVLTVSGLSKRVTRRALMEPGRNLPLFGTEGMRHQRTKSMSEFFVESRFLKVDMLTRKRGCDPLTPDDVAETVVFACSRRENVVVADSLLYPTYQVSSTRWSIGANS